MNGLAQWLVAYGVFNLVLGIVGAAKGSMVSLYAGGGAGVVAIVAGLIARSNPKVGFAIGAVVCLALLGNFVPKLIKEFHIYPGGIAALASILMLGLLIYGHFVGGKAA